MARIIVDGRTHEVKDGDNLLSACLSLGYDLPYFCWHPALGSIGACRQCAVKVFKDESDTRGRIVMACMEIVKDGLRLSVNDPEARAFRASVIEWLMGNHPHDCPVCDEGGECHLQDMTVMSGHLYRRFRYKKRTFLNQDLGPLVNMEMNRCIQCYRCYRFYVEYAGGKDFAVLGANNKLFFGRHREGVLESGFSGNLVEICPTGVFTDKSLKGHFARKWDLNTAPSVCVHCGLGCNTIPGERYGRLRRVRNRYHRFVNGYFLCDRGRYGYEFVNSPGRPMKPRAGKEPVPAVEIPAEEALRRAAGALGPGKSVAGVGSPRASLEANFLLRRLVGAENFYLGVPDSEGPLLALGLEMLRRRRAGPASLKRAEDSDAVLVLGEDVGQTAPRLELALRQAVRNKPLREIQDLSIPEWQNDAVRTAIQDDRGHLAVAAPYPTGLDEIAARIYRAAPPDIARLGLAIAHEIDPSSTPVPELDEEARSAARAVAAALQAGERPLVVAGLAGGDEDILGAAEAVVQALEKSGRNAALFLAFPECNSLGLALLGGNGLGGLLRRAEEAPLDSLVVLENDLFRRLTGPEAVGLLERCSEVMVLDHLDNATAAQATLALPAATFAESTGTLVSSEGRAQRFFKVMPPPAQVRESWVWLRDIGLSLGRPGFERLAGFDDLVQALGEEVPSLKRVPEAAPLSTFRVSDRKFPRETFRFSGRTAKDADRNVSEPKPPQDPDAPLSLTMEGSGVPPPPSLLTYYWKPGWNSVQSLNKFQQEVGGPLKGGDPGLRLIDPTGEAVPAAVPKPPPAFRPEPANLLLVPIYHLFGSEELSVHSPGIEKLRPRPYLLLNSRDAAELGLQEGQLVRLRTGGENLDLPLKTSSGLARGLAGLPAGLPDLAGPDRRGRGKVSRSES
jgi:NADH-quinone oxidoreductase subunit G